MAHICAIFRLPVEIDATALGIHDPLAYIEWFTPFNVVDAPTSMYVVSHSTHQHRCHAAIVPIMDIVQTCHLIPCWGKEADQTWTSSNVLDSCTKFYVNPYLRHQDFVLFQDPAKSSASQ